jgi:hypothetical protein
MAFNFNPLAFRTYLIETRDQRRSFVRDIGDAFNQIVVLLSSPKNLATLFNGQNVLLATALANSLTDLGSPAGNSTLDTKQAAVIAVRVGWTTAANWTLTLNNLAQGAIVLFRLSNSSGAARTFTVLANSPTAAAYTIAVIPSALTAVIVSSGATIANGGSISAIGIAYTTGTPQLHMIGFAA